MGKRRAKSEVTRHSATRSRVGAASLVWLLAACGGADMTAPGTGTAPATGTTPVLPGAGAAGAAALPGAAGAAKPVTGVPATMTTTATGAAVPGAGAVPAAGAASTVAGAATEGGSVLPCNVNKVLASNCQTCHGATPIGGAPMPLVTFADLQKPSKTQPAKKVWELSKERIHDTMRPMPPIGMMKPEDTAALDAWFAGGALAGTAADAACMASAPATTGATGKPEGDGAVGRIVPKAGETCYEFKVHASQDKVDDTKFTVTDGEFYEQFYYKVPWPADSVATSYATIADNAPVLHHWLLFSTNEVQVEGAHITAPLPTLIGTDPVLLAGWAVGGPNLVMPSDVGMELPNPGRTINVQWHLYNSTGMPQSDGSSVQICTVPKSMRPNIGGITWQGTEDLNGNVFTGGAGMPPRMESTFTTTCRPGRGDIPIHIMGFEPHMHRMGKRMLTKVNHMNGMSEVIFDKPFNFGNETHYWAEYDLKPGETMQTSCTFNNDTDRGVPFGESTDTEMCYQFTFHYPAHALTNGAFSLLGVTDTCW